MGLIRFAARYAHSYRIHKVRVRLLEVVLIPLNEAIDSRLAVDTLGLLKLHILVDKLSTYDSDTTDENLKNLE